ncbi:hypothetical protein AOC36_07970 [Erysipelothrix larvae]|uniref:Mga helix-turn-helix domain-containing protein n=1 Tax=Erysipelothrix larvae TaxID=1514105 RepID=A0A0X8H0Q4_9FIRM|nr:helix-turn-helix domain-containing protein [Erysipelothrix larvae]AMC93923.1 hypothetical protein AOC36_07970 [Erysipelothrix larvae]
MHNKRLFFSLNIDKQFSRQVQALEFLSAQQTAVSIHELATRIGCSIPTLRSDLQELNNNLPINIEIRSMGKDGYILIYPPGISIPALIMELAKETDVFRILDALFHNDSYTFDELVAELFVNPSTLRKILTHINQVITEFGVSLSKSPIRFIGSETNIRLFLYNFYYDFNDYFTVDCDFEKNYEAYKTIIDGTRNSLSFPLRFSYFRVTLWIMIIRRRIQSKCFVELDDSIRQRILNEADFVEFQYSFTHTFAEKFLIYKPPLDDIIWAYTIFLHCISYSEMEPLEQSEDVNELYVYQNSDPRHLESINNFLSLEFEPSVIDGPHLHKMRTFLLNLSMLTHLSTQFQRISALTRISLKESLNEYFMIWMRHLYSKESQRMFNIEYREDIAISLAMMHYSTLTHLKKHSIRVLFAFQGEPGYDDFLTQQTQFMIPQNIVPHFSFDEPISEEMISRTQAELVVTNYDSPEFNDLSCDIVRLSYVPSKGY